MYCVLNGKVQGSVCFFLVVIISYYLLERSWVSLSGIICVLLEHPQKRINGRCAQWIVFYLNYSGTASKDSQAFFQ